MFDALPSWPVEPKAGHDGRVNVNGLWYYPDWDDADYRLAGVNAYGLTASATLMLKMAGRDVDLTIRQRNEGVTTPKSSLGQPRERRPADLDGSSCQTACISSPLSASWRLAPRTSCKVHNPL